MTINQEIAKCEMEIFGGKPVIHVHRNELDTKSIDIMRCDNVPQEGVKSIATIGLNAVDTGFGYNGKKICVELVSAVNILADDFDNVIATTAFEIMDAKRCFPGFMVRHAVTLYYEDSEMKHVLLSNPFIWDKFDQVLIDDKWVTWLLVVPISEKEYAFAKEFGTDELETELDKADVDILDIYRKSIF